MTSQWSNCDPTLAFELYWANRQWTKEALSKYVPQLKFTKRKKCLDINLIRIFVHLVLMCCFFFCSHFNRSRPSFNPHNLYQTWPKCSGKVRPSCCSERERRDALISKAQNATVKKKKKNACRKHNENIYFLQKSIFFKRYRIKKYIQVYILHLTEQTALSVQYCQMA